MRGRLRKEYSEEGSCAGSGSSHGSRTQELNANSKPQLMDEASMEYSIFATLGTTPSRPLLHTFCKREDSCFVIHNFAIHKRIAFHV